MISWILDHMPVWVWWALFGGVLICTLPWWLPAFTFVWSRLPPSSKALIIGAGAAASAYLAGRNRGSANERRRQQLRDTRAVQTRTETNDEVARMDDPARKQRLDRWMRD